MNNVINNTVFGNPKKMEFIIEDSNHRRSIEAGNANREGRLGTIELLIKVVCYVKKVNIVFIFK
jgi:hypothetical protein